MGLVSANGKETQLQTGLSRTLERPRVASQSPNRPVFPSFVTNRAKLLACTPQRSSPIAPEANSHGLAATLAQRPGEGHEAFFKRRALVYKDLERSENENDRTNRLIRVAVASRQRCPGRHAAVYEWNFGERSGSGTRRLVAPEELQKAWMKYLDSHRQYDAWTNEWDLNVEFDLVLRYPEDQSKRVVFVCGPHTDVLSTVGSATPVSIPYRYTSIETMSAEAILQLRYGYHLSALMSHPSSTSPCFPSAFLMYLGFIGARKHERIDSNIYHVVQKLEAECVNQLHPRILDIQNDLHPDHQRFLPYARNMSFEFQRLHRTVDRPWYRISCKETDIPLVDLIVGSAVDLLTILRHGGVSTVPDIIAFLVHSGISWTASLKEPRHEPAPPPSRDTAWQPELASFAAYVHKRSELLKDPAIARAALMHGGLIWRLAKDHIDVPLLPPCPPRAHFSHQLPNGMYLHYDQLSDDEIDIICGVYHVAGTQLSWFPVPTTWSECNLGFWTADAESWYQSHVHRCMRGMPCQAPSYWSSSDALLKRSTGLKIFRKMEVLSQQFIDAYFEDDHPCEAVPISVLPVSFVVISSNFRCAYPLM